MAINIISRCISPVGIDDMPSSLLSIFGLEKLVRVLQDVTKQYYMCVHRLI